MRRTNLEVKKRCITKPFAESRFCTNESTTYLPHLLSLSIPILLQGEPHHPLALSIFKVDTSYTDDEAVGGALSGRAQAALQVPHVRALRRQPARLRTASRRAPGQGCHVVAPRPSRRRRVADLVCRPRLGDLMLVAVDADAGRSNPRRRLVSCFFWRLSPDAPVQQPRPVAEGARVGGEGGVGAGQDRARLYPPHRSAIFCHHHSKTYYPFYCRTIYIHCSKGVLTAFSIFDQSRCLNR